MENKRGWMRLIGLILCSILIFVFVYYVENFQVVEHIQSSGWDTTLLSIIGFDVLRTIDLKDECCYNGTSDLRDYIYDENWSGLENEIKKLLPKSIDFTLYLYTYNKSLIYKCGVNKTKMPKLKNRVSIEYLLAGDYGKGCSLNQPCSLYFVLWFKQ